MYGARGLCVCALRRRAAPGGPRDASTARGSRLPGPDAHAAGHVQARAAAGAVSATVSGGRGSGSAVSRGRVLADDLALDDLAVRPVHTGLLEGIPEGARSGLAELAARGPLRIAPEGLLDRRKQQQQTHRVGDQPGHHQEQAAQHQQAVALALARSVPGGRRGRPPCCCCSVSRQVPEGAPAGPLDHHASRATNAGDEQQEDREPAGRAGDHGEQPDLQHQPGGDAQRQERAQPGAPGPGGIRRGSERQSSCSQCAWPRLSRSGDKPGVDHDRPAVRRPTQDPLAAPDRLAVAAQRSCRPAPPRPRP